MSALLMPTARAMSSTAASWAPRASNRPRVATTMSFSRLVLVLTVAGATVTESVNVGYTWRHHDRHHRRSRHHRDRVLPRAQPGPEGHPRLGAWLRREGRAPGGRRMGRARGDALAHHPGGREDRPLWLRGDRSALVRPDRPDAPH